MNKQTIVKIKVPFNQAKMINLNDNGKFLKVNSELNGEITYENLLLDGNNLIKMGIQKCDFINIPKDDEEKIYNDAKLAYNKIKYDDYMKKINNQIKTIDNIISIIHNIMKDKTLNYKDKHIFVDEIKFYNANNEIYGVVPLAEKNNMKINKHNKQKQKDNNKILNYCEIYNISYDYHHDIILELIKNLNNQDSYVELLCYFMLDELHNNVSNAKTYLITARNNLIHEPYLIYDKFQFNRPLPDNYILDRTKYIVSNETTHWTSHYDEFYMIQNNYPYYKAFVKNGYEQDISKQYMHANGFVLCHAKRYKKNLSWNIFPICEEQLNNIEYINIEYIKQYIAKLNKKNEMINYHLYNKVKQYFNINTFINFTKNNIAPYLQICLLNMLYAFCDGQGLYDNMVIIYYVLVNTKLIKYKNEKIYNRFEININKFYSQCDINRCLTSSRDLRKCLNLGNNNKLIKIFINNLDDFINSGNEQRHFINKIDKYKNTYLKNNSKNPLADTIDFNLINFHAIMIYICLHIENLTN